MSKTQRVGSLEIGEDMTFQKVEWVLERAGWALMLAAVAAMFLGLFGKDPKSLRTAGRESDALWARYDRRPRWQTRTPLEIHALPSAADKKARLSLNDDYLKRMMVRQITPAPESIEAAAGKTTFVFSGAERGEPLVVRFHLEPEKPGPAKARLGLGEEHTVAFTQTVFP